MRSTRSLCLTLTLTALTASAQDAGFEGLEPLATLARRAEGIVGGPADAGTRSLAELGNQPLVMYRLRCPDCPELERTAFTVPTALWDTGVPVVLLLGGKNGTRRAAQKLLSQAPANVRIAYGKKLTGPGGYKDVWFYGADGQGRGALSVFSDADAWALQAAAEKLLLEAGGTVPVTKLRAPRVGQPFPPGLVEGLLGGAPDGGNAGPSSLDGYLGQPHVVILACPACGGSAALEALWPIVAASKVPLVTLVSHVASTREMAEQLQRQVGPRSGLRFGWGAKLTPELLRYSASTAFVVDKRGLVRLVAEASSTELEGSSWAIRAALERVTREP